MSAGVSTVVYPVRDLAAAKAIFGALLGEPIMDEPYYVGWRADGQDIGLDPHGHEQGLTGPVGYWTVDDIEATTKTLVEAGATVRQPAKDVGGGKLVAVLTDSDGNPVGLIQPGAWG
jgi:predicted enzyme related to lactoylglutathione lyase